MSGNLLAAARADTLNILTKGGFTEDLMISSDQGANWSTIQGLATGHHINFDTDGAPINSKNVHINIAETTLTEAGFQVRDASGNVNMRGWLVRFNDSKGDLNDFVIGETWPNESLGCIVCSLKDYKDN